MIIRPNGKHQRIVVFGSVGFDHIMALPGRFKDWILPDKIDRLNVSFTVQSLRKEFGGTGGNCAFTLGLLGLKPALVGYLGKDGDEYRRHLGAAGVNLEKVGRDPVGLSASGYVMTDLDDNQVWSYFPGPLTQMASISLKEAAGAGDLAVLLPSEPKAFARHLREAVALKVQFLFDPAFFIPNLTKRELIMGINRAAIVIGNDYEIARLEEKTQTKVAHWRQRDDLVVVQTLGAKGSRLFRGKQELAIPAAPVKQVADPTGAGDAYRAGFIAGFAAGRDLATCGQMGAVAAAYTVETYGTQNHRFTPAEFRQRLRSRIVPG